MKRCTKGFPKELSEVTEFVSDGYVLPKRPYGCPEVVKKISNNVSLMISCMLKILSSKFCSILKVSRRSTSF